MTNTIMRDKLNGIVEININSKMMRFIVDVSSTYFCYDDIKEASIVYEAAKFHGKTKPFEQQIVKGDKQHRSFFNIFVFIGIKVTMKNGDIHYGYVYDKKVCLGRMKYYKYNKIASDIIKVLNSQEID